jgi:hypothetical protein
MPEPSRFVCYRCSVSFRIEQPHSSADRHVCPEAGCHLRFWSAGDPYTRRVRVGVYPDELAIVA